MIFELLILQAAVASVQAAGPEEVFTCEYLASDAAEPHDPPRDDLVLRHTPDVARSEGSWTVTWHDKITISAETFPAQFGSVGGSVALRWAEADGKKQVAFVSFSDVVVADGSKGAWLGLGKPSLWQAPGYLCGTPPLKKMKGGQ